MRPALAFSFPSRTLRGALLGLPACLGLFVLLTFLPLHAQEHTAPPAAGAQSSADRQLAHQSREAAGEEEESTAEFKQSPSVKFLARVTGLNLTQAYWLAVLLNFAVIALLIFWAARKSVPGMLRARTASIQKAMEEARQASEEANRRLSEIETRLSRLDSEVAQMRSVADSDWAAEEARIRAAADEDARKITASAEQEIDAAAKQARRELTQYAADLAVSLAQRQIRIDAPTDQALVRDFAAQLPKGGKGEGN